MNKLSIDSRHISIDGISFEIVATQTAPHRHRLKYGSDISDRMKTYLDANDNWISHADLLRIYQSGRMTYL